MDFDFDPNEFHREPNILLQAKVTADIQEFLTKGGTITYCEYAGDYHKPLPQVTNKWRSSKKKKPDEVVLDDTESAELAAELLDDDDQLLAVDETDSD